MSSLVSTLKKSLGLALGGLLVTAIFVAAPLALAADSTSTTPNNSSSAAASTPSASSTTTTKSTIQDRVANYQKNYAVSLGVAEKARLKTVCKAGQVKVKTLDARITDHNAVRVAVYKDINTRLDKIIPRLKAAGADTTDLTQLQAQLANLISSYNGAVSTYQTALQDLGELDCQADPAAFRAALLAARADQAYVISDASAIRSLITGPIKTALTAARSQLKAAKSSDSTTTTPTTPTTTTPVTGGSQ